MSVGSGFCCRCKPNDGCICVGCDWISDNICWFVVVEAAQVSEKLETVLVGAGAGVVIRSQTPSDKN